MREMKLKDSYDNILNVYIWDDVENPKGVFQLVHGINEHGLRYVELADFLSSKGYIVYINDHVSQGKSRTPQDGDVVYFGKRGDEVLLDGVNVVKEQIKSDYPNHLIYAFGHSLGSIILRNYMIDCDNEYEKIILNGAGLQDTKGLAVAVLVGNVLKLFRRKKPSKFFDSIFRQTQLKLNEKVKIDHFIEWLTRDKEKSELNKQDKLLFISLSVSVFVDMLYLILKINKHDNIESLKFNNPVLLLSGTHDPSTNFGQDTVLLNNLFNKNGVNSKVILYPEGRHDTLQEVNRRDVFNDIINFVENPVEDNYES